MSQASIPAIAAIAPARDNPLTRSKAGLAGLALILAMVIACGGSLPWMLGSAPGESEPRYNAGRPAEGRLAPWWWGPGTKEELRRLSGLVEPASAARIAAAHGISVEQAASTTNGAVAHDLRREWPTHRNRVKFLLGSDLAGRSLFYRCLAGGGISLAIGIAAAFLSVLIGTLYGAIAGYAGGLVDGVMMRIVDILYGLPYVLIIVLLAVASDAAMDEYTTRDHARSRWVHREAAAVALATGADAGYAGVERMLREDPALRESLRRRAEAEIPAHRVGQGSRQVYSVVVLLVAIGGVSWLTMARVVRGQVLSLKNQPFMEAARAMGVGWFGQFRRHLLPNLAGPIIVYATLTVPQAILQESFLSFLGIGVRAPLPSWGNLAAEGLSELNSYTSYWWLLVFPCVLLAGTLLALNFVGEGMREALDPKRARR